MIKNIFIAVSMALSITAITLICLKSEKQAYVDSGKLFAEFKMSKELFRQLESVQKTRDHILDSLYKSVEQYSDFLQKNNVKDAEKVSRLGLMQDEFRYKQQVFQEDNTKMLTEYNTKIWSQVNEYISEYGKEHKYTIILGANGQGSLMYASESKNITPEVLDYINKRYDDKPAQ